MEHMLQLHIEHLPEGVNLATSNDVQGEGCEIATLAPYIARWMLRCASLAPTGRDWNGCCVTARAHPSRWITCSNGMPNIWSITVPSHGQTGPVIWC